MKTIEELIKDTPPEELVKEVEWYIRMNIDDVLRGPECFPWHRVGHLPNKPEEKFIVLGPNTSDGTLWRWGFDDKINAAVFAKNISRATRAAYEIYEAKLVGIMRPVEAPVEFIEPSLED